MYIKIGKNDVVISALIGVIPKDAKGYINTTDADFPLFDGDCIPLYKWDGEKVIPRAAAEIQADRAALPKPGPTLEEQTRMNSAAILSIMREMQRRR